MNTEIDRDKFTDAVRSTNAVIKKIRQLCFKVISEEKELSAYVYSDITNKSVIAVETMLNSGRCGYLVDQGDDAQTEWALLCDVADHRTNQKLLALIDFYRNKRME